MTPEQKQIIANLINAINYNIENGGIKFQYISEELSEVMELLNN